MAFHGRQSVRVVACDCDRCLASLSAGCAASGLPAIGEVGTFGVVPISWIGKRCRHGRRGLELERVEPDDVPETSVEPPILPGRSSSTLQDQKAFQQSRWRELFPDPIDGTKGIGYPARETGRYGSHPQHDGSGDE
jgi:hypothetical protein